jgi:predicted transcriptional regulator
MTLPQAWMQQAESDYRTAQRVDNDADARTRCQAISKYQQCVEKSVKGVLDRLYDAGITNAHSDSGHHVARYADMFRNLPRTKETSGLLNQLARLFTDSVVAQINFVDSLVPVYPAAGALAARNHEYPFQHTPIDWRAPSDQDAFTAGEIRRIRTCAGSLIRGLRRIFDALELLFP